MEPEHGFWFRKLRMEWWERPPLDNKGKYGQKKQMDGSNNLELECRMR